MAARRTTRSKAAALEARGQLREALAVARLAVRAVFASALSDDAARAAALIDRARLAWRVGQPREAMASLRALRRVSRGLEAAPVRFEASLLRATLALERGATTRARVALAAARATAEEAGDDESLARVLRRLGTLHARTGKPAAAAGAYRAALGALRRVAKPAEPQLEALLCANLATMEAWLGRHEVARALYESALAQRSERPIEALNTRAALALLDAACGRRPPGGSFGPLVEEAERLGDPRLRAELASYRVEELVFEGRLTAAEGVVGAARAALADLGGAEVILDAMVDLSDALLRARRGERGAASALARAVEQLGSSDARYHAARAARNAATGLVWLGDDEGATAYIAKCAALTEPAGFVLGGDLVHVVALALGALRGEAATAAYAIEVLDRLGPIRVEGALRREGRADLARAWVEQTLPVPVGAPFRALGPEGTRALTLVERDALIATRDAVVLDRSRALLFVPGRSARRLDRMRAIEPLLAHLIARRPEPVFLDELARVVWSQRPTASVVSAITTSIARLRRLLGRAARIVTTGVGARRAYELAPEAVVWRIDVASAGARQPAVSGAAKA